MIKSARRVALAASTLAAVLLPFSTPAAAEEPQIARFELSKLVGVFTDLAPDLLPVERGPVTIRASSPSHRMVVHGNELTLRRVRDDWIAADFRVDFEGEGKLVAILEAGASSRLEDEVVVPRQTLRVAGTIRLRRVEGGYDVAFEELQDTANVHIESRLLGSLVSACQGLAALLRIDCDALGNELSTVRAPLPKRGETAFLDDGWLDDDERAFFDRFASKAE